MSILGGATLIVAAAGWIIGASTNQLSAFGSSAIGTAAGGMLAVWAAFFFWVYDHKATRVQKQIDEQAARDQRLADDTTARNRARSDVSRDASIRILSRAVTVHDFARQMRTDRDRASLDYELMKADLLLVNDASVRSQLDEAIEFFDPNDALDKYMSISFSTRTWQGQNWIKGIVTSYVTGDPHASVRRPADYVQVMDGVRQLREWYEESYAFHLEMVRRHEAGEE